MSFRFGVGKSEVLACLADGVPRFRYEIVEETKKSESRVSDILTRLWKEGAVLHSRERVTVTYVDSAPGKGKFWRKMSAHLWIHKESPRVLPSGIVEFEVKKTEKYTLESKMQKLNIPFIGYQTEELTKKLSQKAVIDFMKKRAIGVVAREVGRSLITGTLELRTCWRSYAGKGNLKDAATTMRD